MEKKYPTLRRPRRKLCYLTNKESLSKPWTGTLTLGDVDRLFDDINVSSYEDDLCSTSPLLSLSDTEINPSEREASPVAQEGPEGDCLSTATRTLSPKLDADLCVPFKVHGPVKTSSPFEKNVVEEDNEKKQAMSLVLFDCGDEEKEEAKTESPTIQRPLCNGSEDSDLESPPSKVTLSKVIMSSHKNKLEESCKESHPVKETHKCRSPVLQPKRETQRQENTDPPVSEVRLEPDLAAPEKHSQSFHSQSPAETSIRAGKDMTAFRRKLRDAGQLKPACSRDLLPPVEVHTITPVTEEDFLILEDDAPLWFAIPSKNANNKRRKKSRSPDKETSTIECTKDCSLETTQKEDELEKENTRRGNLPGKKKGKQTMDEVTGPGYDENESSSPEDIPAYDLLEQEKTNKTQAQLKNIPSKRAKERPKDTPSREPDKEKPSQKMEKRAQKSFEMNSSESSKDGKESGEKSRVISLKGTRKVIQGSEDIKEMLYKETMTEQSQEQNIKKPAEVEDFGSLSDKDMMNSDTETAIDLSDEKAEQNQQLVESDRSSFEENQIVGKRKRKQAGRRRLKNPQSIEVKKVTDNQPTLKKTKKDNKEPNAVEPPPVKVREDRVLRKRNWKQSALSSSQSTIKAQEWKTKQSKSRPATRDTPDKMKAMDEVFNTTEAEPIEEQDEQQEVLDQDQDPEYSSPLVFRQKDLSLNSGEQVFQRVYSHVSNEKIFRTAALVSPRRPQEQLRTAGREKRKRTRPGKWWMVNSTCEDVESISSCQQPNPKEPKSRKEIKKRSKRSKTPRLGTPKNGNMAVSSKPPGGAPKPSLKLKQTSAPKTVKHSLDTFKDIFTSATESPTVISIEDIGHNNRNNVTACPAEEVILSKSQEGILSMDASEFRSTVDHPLHHDTPQDSSWQPDNMFNGLRSGPSSMIVLERNERKDLIVPSSRAHAVLSVSDMCVAPLKPLVLQPKDKANLTEWLKTLWSTNVDNGVEIAPDHFDWYFYQDRAIGFLVDIKCDSFCNGKILLGSYMKKPLWVDHSTTTVFNLLTSSVTVTINGSESRFYPGQSFMVKCGDAYSIQNATAQPAVLYFTRILVES